MYPNQNQPQMPSQYPIDYLNQIAPQPQKRGLDNKKFLLIVGGGLLVAIIVGFFAFFNSGTTPKEKMETLSARLTTLQKIATKSQKSIKSSSLRGTNGSLALLLTNATHDIIEPLKANGIEIEKIDKDITKAEDGEKLSAKLEDARLNAVFDRTYTREMTYQLETVHVLMTDIYSKTSSKSMKTFLDETDKNLTPIKKSLQEFNAANG